MFFSTAANISTFMQLLKHKNHEKYMVWERTFSMDNIQDSMEPGKEFDTINQAKYYWGRRFKSKTGNDWSDYPGYISVLRCKDTLEHNFRFIYKQGKFNIINRSYKIEEQVDENAKEELEPAVNELIKMICDQNMLQQAANDIELDTQKIPLGYLSEEQERHSNSYG